MIDPIVPIDPIAVHIPPSSYFPGIGGCIPRYRVNRANEDNERKKEGGSYG